MRYFFSILLLLSTIRANSQVAIYNLVLFDSCSNSSENALLYNLERNGITFSISDTLGTIELDTTGLYNLRADFTFINTQITIDSGRNIDTLATEKIRECIEPVSHPKFIGYCCCSENCDGFQQDFYNNGNIRMEGTFSDGIPTGEVKYYYRDGTLQMIKFYNRKGILKRTEEHS